MGRLRLGFSKLPTISELGTDRTRTWSCLLTDFQGPVSISSGSTCCLGTWTEQLLRACPSVTLAQEAGPSPLLPQSSKLEHGPSPWCTPLIFGLPNSTLSPVPGQLVVGTQVLSTPLWPVAVLPDSLFLCFVGGWANPELGDSEAKVPDSHPQRPSCCADVCPWTRRGEHLTLCS